MSKYNNNGRSGVGVRSSTRPQDDPNPVFKVAFVFCCMFVVLYVLLCVCGVTLAVVGIKNSGWAAGLGSGSGLGPGWV